MSHAGARLIALAGLPGTGKTPLARALGAALGAPVLDKDAVRAELVPPGQVAYTTEQDDAVMEAVYARAAALIGAGARHVIVDGRTFTKAAAVERLRAAAAAMGAELLIVECVCATETARARLAADQAAGRHPAANRGPELHARLLAAAEPIAPPTLVLDTDRLALDVQVATVRAALRG